MTLARMRTGKYGEDIACSFLKRNGYKILEKNYRTSCGEIDIIGDDSGCVTFIEVRTSSGDDFRMPEESINARKQAQVSRAALAYIKKKHLENEDCRFDVVCIKGLGTKAPGIELIKNAFDLPERYRY